MPMSSLLAKYMETVPGGYLGLLGDLAPVRSPKLQPLSEQHPLEPSGPTLRVLQRRIGRCWPALVILESLAV
jgi:hypothetical protein